MRRHHLACLASLAFFSLGGLMAACGGDDDEAPPSTKPKPSATAGAGGASGAAGAGGSAGSGAGAGGGAGVGGSAGAGGSVTPVCASTTDQKPPTSLESYVAQYVPAYCANAAACCTTSKSKDPCDCQEAFGGSLSLVLKDLTYDEAQGTACLAALRAQFGKSTACDALTKGIDACQKALVLPAPAPTGSNSPPGGPCTTVDDCAPVTEGTARCQEVGFDSTKKVICQQVLEGASGATPCIGDARQTFAVNEDDALTVGTVYRCKEGLVCDASSRTCGSGVALGGDCFLSEECGGDAYCKDSKCTPSIADGAACTKDSECKLASFCSSTSVCKPYLAAGAACDSAKPDDKCSSGACLNGQCSTPGGSAQDNLFCGF